MACPQKNRYGKTGISSWWVHNKQKAYAESSFRLEDEDWCKMHGLVSRDIAVEGEKFRQQMIAEAAQEDTDSEIDAIFAEKEAFEASLSTNKKFWRWFCGMN